MRLNEHIKYGTVKPQLQPPCKWRMSDVTTRDPVMFLCEVLEYAHAYTLRNNFNEPEMQLDLDVAMRAYNTVSWPVLCETFLKLIGKDFYNPAQAATVELIRGELKQDKSVKVLEYVIRYRAVVSRAELMPQVALCDLFVRGLNFELRRDCMRTEGGQVWDDLNKCIAHALGKERIMSMRQAGSAAHVAECVVVSNADRPYKLNTAPRARFQVEKQPYSQGEFTGASAGNKRQRSGLRPARSDDECHTWGQMGHFSRDCPQQSADGGRGNGRGRGGGRTGRCGCGGGRSGGRGTVAAAAGIESQEVQKGQQ